MVELVGSLSKIIYKSDRDSFMVGIFEAEEGYITITGNFPNPVEKQMYEIKGELVYHKKYGEQVKILQVTVKLPREKTGMIAFLASGAIRGVGIEKATAIVDMFGEKTFDVIENQSQLLLNVKDIGEKTKDAIVEGFKSYGQGAAIYSYFQGLGLSHNIIDKIYEMYDVKAIEIFEENPYAFIGEFKGLGFLKIDKAALEEGIALEDERRLKSGVMHVLNLWAANGNTFVEKRQLIKECEKLLGVDKEMICEAVCELAIDLKIRAEADADDEKIYLFQNYEMENAVARYVLELESGEVKELPYEIENLIKETEREYDMLFSKEQRYSIEEALNSGISIITGGPGTGKTTVIRALIHILEYAGVDVVLTAPTGRAAKRMSETTGRSACTIHRLLEYYADDSQVMKFNKNRENSLKEDVIILDEASMVDLHLMKSLMDAMKNGSRLILVGDEDQLPSIGIGNVLGDMISSKRVPCFKLKEIFRQAEESNIVINAHEINRGIKPQFANGKNGDVFYLERRDEEEALKTISELCENRLEKYFPIDDKVADIQVISPSKKGILGSESLNKSLQEVLNSKSDEKISIRIGDIEIRNNDKVMHTKNNYEIKWQNNVTMEDGKGIFNGEIGIVQKISVDEELIYILFDDEKLATYSYEDARELALGYCMTVHKSQGSEFPVVIIPLFKVPYMLANRSLIYTAITRGKQGVILVGDRKYLDLMVENNSIKNRNSDLANRIDKVFENMYQ